MNEYYRWNLRKAAANRRDHGIAFEEVGEAFRDPFAVEWIDDREEYGEERINLLAMCGGLLLHVTYTERGDHIRLIPARRAERHEQDRYHRENSA